ncbi:hypothetical protein [Hyphomonas sp.]|uniref:hypothetical protein n=1 Tax=Hyphomonas sp. TaxID=87 RepID=UPI003D2C5641
MERAIAIAVLVRDYLGIPPDLTFWDLANSELIIAVATLTIGVVVNRRVGRIAEKVDDNQLGEDLTKELQERATARTESALRTADVDVPADFFDHLMEADEGTSELAMAPAPVAPQPAPAHARKQGAPDSAFFGKQANFIGGADIIGTLKEYVDRAADHVSDGRKKRKYSNLGKRDYRVIILALEDDGVISHSVASELLTAFDAWRPYSTNAAAVPDDVIDLLQRTKQSLEDANGNMRHHRRRRNV